MVVAFFALIVLQRAAIRLVDGDAFWHIRAGEVVLDTGRVPDTDTWSIVGEGGRWVSQDWLSNVLMAAGYRLGEIGPTVVSMAWALLVVIGLTLLWLAYDRRRPAAGWLGRILLLGAAVVVAGPTLGPRVQVVDLVMASVTILCLWGYLADRRARWLWALPLISIAWANLHAGWPLVFVLGGAVIAGEIGDRITRRQLPAAPLSNRELVHLSAALALSLATIAINPNGPALFLYPIETSTITAHRDFIEEWQPLNPAGFIGRVVIGFGVLVVIPALWIGLRRGTLRLADVLIIVGLMAMMVLAVRFMLFAPLVAITAGLSLEPALAASAPGARLSPALRRLAVPRSYPGSIVIGALLVAVAVAGVAVALFRLGPEEQQRALARSMPVAAVDWILANDPGDRPFNEYLWGGYLGLRQPEEPIFIDGRSDIYGDLPIRSYADAVSLKTDPSILLDGHAIDYVLFPVGRPLSEWLDDQPGWERVYQDSLAGVWARSP